MKEPILIVLCARFTVEDIAASIDHACSHYGMIVEHHHIPQAHNAGEPKHPLYYDSLKFQIIEHNLFSTGHKVGSLVVRPAINDCLGFRDIDIHVIGSDVLARQAIVQRLHREFRALHSKADIVMVPFGTSINSFYFMPYSQECTILAELKGTTVNIAFKSVRETALLDDVLRATGVPSICMEKERV
jgi:hypothetical protein